MAYHRTLRWMHQSIEIPNGTNKFLKYDHRLQNTIIQGVLPVPEGMETGKMYFKLPFGKQLEDHLNKMVGNP